MRIGKSIAVAMVVATIGAGSARAEKCNQYTPLPSVNVSVYNITIAGNVIGQLNLGETMNDPHLNPFQYAIDNFAADAGGTTTVTAALDSHGNTVVTFKGLESDGTTPIALNSGDSFLYSSHANGLPHIGLDGGDSTPPLHILSQGWSNSSNSFASPAVSASVSPAPTGMQTRQLRDPLRQCHHQREHRGPVVRAALPPHRGTVHDDVHQLHVDERDAVQRRIHELPDRDPAG